MATTPAPQPPAAGSARVPCASVRARRGEERSGSPVPDHLPWRSIAFPSASKVYESLHTAMLHSASSQYSSSQTEVRLVDTTTQNPSSVGLSKSGCESCKQANCYLSDCRITDHTLTLWKIALPDAILPS